MCMFVALGIEKAQFRAWKAQWTGSQLQKESEACIFSIRHLRLDFRWCVYPGSVSRIENRGANVNRKDSSTFGSRRASVGQFFKDIQTLWYSHADSGRVTQLRARDTVQTIQVRKVEDFHIRIYEHITPIQHSEETKGDDSLIRRKRSVRKINICFNFNSLMTRDEDIQIDRNHPDQDTLKAWNF